LKKKSCWHLDSFIALQKSAHRTEESKAFMILPRGVHAEPATVTEYRKACSESATVILII